MRENSEEKSESSLKRIDIEDTWVEISSIHVEGMHPRLAALSTTPLTNHSQFMLEIFDRVVIDDELRRLIVSIHITENRSVVQLTMMSNSVPPIVDCFRVISSLYRPIVERNKNGISRMG